MKSKKILEKNGFQSWTFFLINYFFIFVCAGSLLLHVGFL